MPHYVLWCVCSIYHLAAVPSSGAEANYELGLQVQYPHRTMFLKGQNGKGDDSDVATGITMVLLRLQVSLCLCNSEINITRIRGTSKNVASSQRRVDTKCTHSCTGECGWDKSNHQAMQSFRTFSKTCILKLCCCVWTFASECYGIADAQHIELSKKNCYCQLYLSIIFKPIPHQGTAWLGFKS